MSALARRKSPPRRPRRVPPARNRRKNAKYVSAQATTGDTFPTPLFQIAYGSGPTTDLTTATWTNETQYLRSGSLSRGRSGSFDEITTSTAQAVLRDETRHFDPDYNTDIVPLLPTRFGWTFNGSYYPLWTGYTTGNPQVYFPPLYAECPISCVDAFEVLQSAKTLGTPWKTQAAILAPDHWFRLSDDTSIAVDHASGTSGIYVGGYTQSAASLVVTDTDSALTLAGSGYVFLPSNVCPVSTSTFTVAGWFKSPTAGTNHRTLVAFNDGASSNTLTVQINRGPSGTAGWVTVNYAINGGVGSAAPVSNAAYDDNTAHHFAVVRDGTNLLLYIDAVLLQTTAIGAGTSATAVPGAIGASPDGSQKYTGDLDEIMLWKTAALTAQQVTDLYHAGTDGWSGDTTGQRINRYLDAGLWPAAMRDIDLGRSTMTGAGSVSDALAGITEAVKAEAGLLDVTPLGKVRFRDRYRRLKDGNSTAPIATFGDGGGAEIPYFYQGFQPNQDRDRIRTQATGNRTGGATITVTDTGNRAGIRTEPLGELALLTDSEVRGRLEHLVGLYKSPQYRVDAMTIRPGTLPGSDATWTNAMLWSIVLGVDLGWQFKVLRRPQNVGSAKTWTVLVEQISHTFSPQDWTTVLALSPADTRPKARWGRAKWNDPDARWAF